MRKKVHLLVNRSLNKQKDLLKVKEKATMPTNIIKVLEEYTQDFLEQILQQLRHMFNILCL